MEDARKLNRELFEQYLLAGSSETSPEKLRVLAEHFCDKIRMRVAENPRTPRDVLRNLGRDPNPDVRVALASNHSCESSVLIKLARDDDAIVRHGLAQSIDTPKMILERLAEDDNGWVRGEALKSLHIINSRSEDEVGRRRSMKLDRFKKAESGLKKTENFDERVQVNEGVAS